MKEKLVNSIAFDFVTIHYWETFEKFRGEKEEYLEKRLKSLFDEALKRKLGNVPEQELSRLERDDSVEVIILQFLSFTLRGYLYISSFFHTHCKSISNHNEKIKTTTSAKRNLKKTKMSSLCFHVLPLHHLF
jgi:hypothetical protein